MHLSAIWKFWPFQRSWTDISWGAYELSYSGGGVAQVENKAQRWGVQKCEDTLLLKDTLFYIVFQVLRVLLRTSFNTISKKIFVLNLPFLKDSLNTFPHPTKQNAKHGKSFLSRIFFYYNP